MNNSDPRPNLPNDRVLDVKGLSVTFGSGAGTVRAVESLDLHLDRGETLAIVGESGSGCDVTRPHAFG